MATIHDLMRRIADDELRTQLEKEVRRLTGQKKFGLVFEEHLPEAAPLYGMKIKVGMTVATRAQDGGALFVVKSIKDNVATCVPCGKTAGTRDSQGDTVSFPLDELVAVAKFGDPIYPVLEPIDKIEHGGGDLWHALIQADNYLALQLLEYLYPGKVDCIYIDPPYNTGARDWKYNNDYVDKDDAYRHSKWLSMMKRRLGIAKKLLNPKGSVLIVTIDDKEYLHLGMLLEEMFQGSKITMVSSVINPAGKAKKGGVDFSRTDEYIFFIQIGSAGVIPEMRDVEKTPIAWETFRRHSLANGRGKHGVGACGPNQFYPIYVNQSTRRIEKFGAPIPENMSRFDVPQIPGCAAVFPVRDDGTEMNWGGVREEAERRYKLGYLRVGEYSSEKPQQYSIQYLTKGTIKGIESGAVVITGRNADNSIEGYFPIGKAKVPTTNWNKASHNATSYGTDIVNKLLCGAFFDYPKSLYAVYDCLKLFVKENKNALIVDFFSGSGTTLHAVNLLNAEDGGRRRCIMVTNNEISDVEEKQFRAKGIYPGDEEWEKLGIAQHVTWPRTLCSFLGKDVKGNLLPDCYGVEADDFTVDDAVLAVSKDTGKNVNRGIYRKIKRQLYPGLAGIRMSDGFAANCEFFKLAFVNKDAVALGRQFREILPLLWMRSGAKGARPELKRGAAEPEMMVLPENGMAILLKEYAFAAFAKSVKDNPRIDYVYLVTDSEQNYRDMARSFDGKDCVQIYRHYLDNFRINKFVER